MNNGRCEALFMFSSGGGGAVVMARRYPGMGACRNVCKAKKARYIEYSPPPP